MTDLNGFATKNDLLDFLKENKSIIIAEKKAATKYADAVSFAYTPENAKGEVVKVDNNNDFSNLTSMTAKLVLNTTGIMDSHSDVHIKGIWKKTLQEVKRLPLLQEHVMKFQNVITENVQASTKNKKWSDLGMNYEGSTEALIFDVEIDKDRNEYMFEQYAKGYVKNHSVGMRYVKVLMCVDSTDNYWREEKDNWDEYISQVVNQDVAKAQGVFWAVKEAKLIEGSAVVLGSNQVTPTLNVSTKSEPSNDTQQEQPSKSTVTIDQFKELFKQQLKN